MAIPDFQRIMLPLLKFCADGQEHTNREAIDSLAKEFGLTEDEQKQLLPSGQQCVFDNRVAWARAHMKMADLLENTSRGIFRRTSRVFTAMPAFWLITGSCSTSREIITDLLWLSSMLTAYYISAL